MFLSKRVMCDSKKQRLLTKNLNNVEGFEHLFSIARRAGKIEQCL